MSEIIKNSPPIRIESTSAYFKSFCNKIKENISSSMSGIHKGNFIAANENPYNQETTAIVSSIPWNLDTQ